MRDKLIHFMAGRYGNDSLNYFLLGCYLLVTIFFRNSWLSAVGLLLFFIVLYRFMSKDYYARCHENDLFIQLIRPLSQHFKAFKNNLKDKNRKYFVCSKCYQVVRVPAHRGRIEITCPTCRNKFIRKS
ncbi:MAG: hypothetical protein ACI4U3_02295 [Traorella sp.]